MCDLEMTATRAEAPGSSGGCPGNGGETSPGMRGDERDTGSLCDGLPVFFDAMKHGRGVDTEMVSSFEDGMTLGDVVEGSNGSQLALCGKFFGRPKVDLVPNGRCGHAEMSRNGGVGPTRVAHGASLVDLEDSEGMGTDT